ncbi:MAG: hypothetical protein JO285_01775 [Kutzneria sp.]|nr:hypothetical protein [Kutzneria sp.]
MIPVDLEARCPAARIGSRGPFNQPIYADWQRARAAGWRELAAVYREAAEHIPGGVCLLWGALDDAATELSIRASEAEALVADAERCTRWSDLTSVGTPGEPCRASSTSVVHSRHGRGDVGWSEWTVLSQ